MRKLSFLQVRGPKIDLLVWEFTELLSIHPGLFEFYLADVYHVFLLNIFFFYSSMNLFMVKQAC